LSTGGDFDWSRCSSVLRADGLDLLDDVHSLDDGAKDHVFAIEPAGGGGAQEELRAVGVGARVRHREDTGAGVLEGEVLVGEFVAVDRLAASAVVVREIATLAHETGNDSVEAGSGISEALFSGAEGAEVLGGARDNVVAQFHHDASGILSANGHVKVASSERHC